MRFILLLLIVAGGANAAEVKPLVIVIKDSPVNGTSAPVFRLMSDS